MNDAQLFEESLLDLKIGMFNTENYLPDEFLNENLGV
jgi:hypothetical protein